MSPLRLWGVAILILPWFLCLQSLLYHLLPNSFWMGQWSRVVLFLPLVILFFASRWWTRRRQDDVMPIGATQFTKLAFASATGWLLLVPLTMGLRLQFGSPVLAKDACAIISVWRDIKVCAGRDRSFLRESRRQWRAVGEPQAWLCAQSPVVASESSLESQPRDALKVSQACQWREWSHWPRVTCASLGAPADYDCRRCVGAAVKGTRADWRAALAPNCRRLQVWYQDAKA